MCKIQTHKTEIHPLSYLKVRLQFTEWPWAPAWMLLTGLWRRPQRGGHHAVSAKSQHRMGWPWGQLLTTLLPHLEQVMDTPHTHTPPKPAVFTNMALGRISSAVSPSTALQPTRIQRLLVPVLKDGQGESENPTCFQPERSQTKQVEHLPSALHPHPGNSEEEMR